MAKSWWIRTDWLMRWLHLYTGLFLVPWMMVYAASAFCLNHGPWINETFGITPPEWKTEREVSFVPHDAFPRVPEEQAGAILRHLDLEGAHRILGSPTPEKMVIFRFCGSGNYRVTWHCRQSQLVVEHQQPFSYYYLMHFLHFRHGYDGSRFVDLTWAVVVDVVTVSTVIWVVSGIYLWARKPRKRLPGGVCLVAGCLLFAGLVVGLCL